MNDDQLIDEGWDFGAWSGLDDADLMALTLAMRAAMTDPGWPQDDPAGDAQKARTAEAELRRRGLIDAYERTYADSHDEARRIVHAQREKVTR